MKEGPNSWLGGVGFNKCENKKFSASLADLSLWNNSFFGGQQIGLAEFCRYEGSFLLHPLPFLGEVLARRSLHSHP